LKEFGHGRLNPRREGGSCDLFEERRFGEEVGGVQDGFAEN